jgi:hypothetical protein
MGTQNPSEPEQSEIQCDTIADICGKPRGMLPIKWDARPGDPKQAPREDPLESSLASCIANCTIARSCNFVTYKPTEGDTRGMYAPGLAIEKGPGTNRTGTARRIRPPCVRMQMPWIPHRRGV